MEGTETLGEPRSRKPAPSEPDGRSLRTENCEQALARVKSNKGSPGIDGMTVDDFPNYLKDHWPTIRAQLLRGSYQPQPVKRVEIPKPDGGMRKLGIPRAGSLHPAGGDAGSATQLGPHVFGTQLRFSPGRSAHQAVAQAQQYIAEGYRWVVDIDLEKFFDRVNHDKLMAKLAKRISDKRLLKLIRAFLHAGVMENGLVSPVDEGTPQGGPLSPLLSNIVLDEFDRELERRGHRFVRYADDCNIYVRSREQGNA